MSDPFWLRVDRVGECWLWRGPVSNGYGVCVRHGVQGAHRVSRVLMGKAAVGILRNMCGHLHCVRPEHWDDVPKRVPVLVARSLKVRELFLSGKSRSAIAHELGLSLPTVGKYVRMIEVGPPEGEEKNG